MKENYFCNLLENHNYIAKPNIAWVADITSFDLIHGRKIYAYFCIDVYSNCILISLFRTKPIVASEIVKRLQKVVNHRFPIPPRQPVIIHTDRGSQFTSQTYNTFIENNKDYVIASMSRANTPKDNPVIERFIRTFKEHKINDRTFQEELFYQLERNSKFQAYQRIFNLYVKNLNLKPNRKSNLKSPQAHDLSASIASELMLEPKYPKALSEHYGDDYRREHIDQFKKQNNEIVSLFEEMATKKAELVDKTPFDNYETKLLLDVFDEHMKSVYKLVQQNPETTREYVEETLAPMQDMLESMDEKINLLLPKKKQKRTVLPLRDPIDGGLFKLFFNAAGSKYRYKADLRMAQLRIAYTILFYTGLRVNEIRHFTEKQIKDAIKTSQFSVVHSKQKKAHIHVLSDLAVQELKGLKKLYQIVFLKYKFKFLFGKDKPVGEKYLITLINDDLKHTCQLNQIPYNIKSHSFRIHMITKLLRNTTVQDAADIIGHSDIKSTMTYNRYSLNRNEIQTLLNKIDIDT